MTLFGGLFTEADPTALPPGASPLVVNCDFEVGGVTPRPGKQNEFSFGNSSSEKITGFAKSIAGAHAPNETAWNSPNNVTKNIPGTYAAVTLNVAGGSFPAGGTFDNFFMAQGTSSVGTPLISVSGVPRTPNELALLLTNCGNDYGGSLGSPGAGWTLLDQPNGGPSTLYAKALASVAAITPSQTVTVNALWTTQLLLFGASVPGVTPNIVQRAVLVSGGISVVGPTTVFNSFGAPVTPGNGILVVFSSGNKTNFSNNNPCALTSISATDSKGNPYTVLGQILSNGDPSTPFPSPGSLNAPTGAVLWAPNTLGGNTTVTVALNANQPNVTFSGSIVMYEIGGIAAIPATQPYSQILQATNFNLNIPASQNIVGLQVELFGNQTVLLSDAVITAQLILPDGTLSASQIVGQLPSVDGKTTLGLPKTGWGVQLTPALLNNPNFGVQLFAVAPGGEVVTFSMYAVKLLAWLSLPSNFNYLKTFEQTDGDILTLALDSTGTIWQEDAINNPNVLNAVYTAVEPNTFAQSATQSDREFIALSNLLNGTDVPYTYNGVNFDRLSQVGPGTAPSVAANSSGSAVTSITQAPPIQIRRITWGASSNAINDSTPGNILTIFQQGDSTHPGSETPLTLLPGQTIVLSGIVGTFPNVNLNGTYTVLSVGRAVVGGNGTSNVFTVQAPSVRYGRSADFGIGGGVPTSGWFWQATLATMTTAAQVPNLQVANTFQLAGTGGSPTSGYDGSWSVIGALNAAQLQITSTQRIGNVATFGYNLISGTAPVVGQAVTVAQTLNGNGAFNVSNVVITAASPGSFSIGLVGPDVANSAETGTGIIFGTIFTFDPLVIVGNKTGGTIVSTGVIAAGIRKVGYCFLTRNGYITQPSPITTVTIGVGASQLIVSNLLPGPSNVIARIIISTAANGGNFFDIAQPVIVNNNGQNVVNSSTWVRDNTSTTATLSFSDGVLLAQPGDDIQGNNLFETAEVGSCTGVVPYANRIFTIREQNKLTNFINWSFDGGILGSNSGSGTNTTYPAGWNLDPTNGGGVSVISSPLFGFAYAVTNATGSTQTTYGMITQGAFQDEFLVPIIQAATTYSVRLTAAVPTGATTGNLVVDLFSPSLGKAVGAFTLPLSSLATTMNIFTGTLLTSVLQPVPSDLILRMYATAILNGVIVTVDRVEVFPTEQPNLATQVTGSYVNNFEAMDQVTGVIDTASENQQPVSTAFVQDETLYLVKTGSLVSTQDNGTTEPVHWPLRTISPVVGTPSVNGVDSGEGWAVIAGIAGLYIFTGGEPIKLSEEIQSLWNLINWQYGYTLWVTNDIVNRRILVGVPLKTQTINPQGKVIQNPWIPAGIIPVNANPTTPNVVIELNYKQLNTASALADSPEVHSSAYTGKLIARDYSRKWAVWTVKSPCAAFIKRADQTTPLFIGNSDATGKIYGLVDGLLSDDGSAIFQIYTTYGFVSPEIAESSQMGLVRLLFEFMTALLAGTGSLQIQVLPNTLQSPYAHALLPNLTLPGPVNGEDVEIPVNETANRLFVQFSMNAPGQGFSLSKIVMVMRQDPWAPVRGTNG